MGPNRPQAGYGSGFYVMEAEPNVSPAEVKAKLLSLFQSNNYEPPMLPSIALELVRLTRKANVNVTDIVGVLEQEPMLAARLIQMSHSALHAGAVPVRSLHQAVVRLGLGRTADFFMRAALEMRVFRSGVYQESMNQLRRHCAATAELARLIGRETPAFDEYAFMCGLLHDVGYAACFIALADGTPAARVPSLEEVLPTLREIHEASAEALTRIWKLPPEIGIVIGHHHQFVIDGRPHPLAAVVCLADALAAEMGFGFGEEVQAEAGAEAMRCLNLSVQTQDRIRSTAEIMLRRIQ